MHCEEQLFQLEIACFGSTWAKYPEHIHEHLHAHNFWKLYDLLLFPEKRLNLILVVVHKSHVGPLFHVICKSNFQKLYLFFFRKTTYQQHYNSSRQVHKLWINSSKFNFNAVEINKKIQIGWNLAKSIYIKFELNWPLEMILCRYEHCLIYFKRYWN